MSIRRRMFLFFGLLASVVLGFLFFVQSAYAGPEHNVHGYAWSDTFGWISMNCMEPGTCATVNYGVHVDRTTGYMSGYAWSPILGWIDFSPGVGCPSGSGCEARVYRSSGAVRGWVRAVNATAGGSTGGFDGWIRLYYSRANVSLDLNTYQFSGYAWSGNHTVGNSRADTGVGWIDFSGGGYGQPVELVEIYLDVYPTVPVSPGTNARIEWEGSPQLINCVSTAGALPWYGGGSNAKPSPPGYLDVEGDYVTTTTTYAIQCETPSGLVVTDDATLTVDTGLVTVTLSATPQTHLPYLGSTTLNWTTTGNPVSCTASSSRNNWTGSKSPLGGSELITDIRWSYTYYTIYCTSSTGVDSAPITVRVDLDRFEAPSSECINGWGIRYFNHVSSHPDFFDPPPPSPHLPSGDPLSVVSPWLHDWYDDNYFTSDQFRSHIRFGDNFFPFDPGGSNQRWQGEPPFIGPGGVPHDYFFGVHFQALVGPDPATGPGLYSFTVTSDDDVWVYADINDGTGPQLIESIPGTHPPTSVTSDMQIEDDTLVQIFFADRITPWSHFWFDFDNPDLDITPYGVECERPKPYIEEL